jgi:hypothetical protein
MSTIDKLKQFINSQEKYDNLTYDSANCVWYGVKGARISEFFVGRDKNVVSKDIHLLSEKKIEGENSESYPKSDKYDASNNYLKFSVKPEGNTIASPSNLLVISQSNQDEYTGNIVMSEVKHFSNLPLYWPKLSSTLPLMVRAQTFTIGFRPSQPWANASWPKPIFLWGAWESLNFAGKNCFGF